MKSWLCASLAVLSGLLVLLPTSGDLGAQPSPQKKRKIELSLAGLRPGRDKLQTAIGIHGPFFQKVKPDSEKEVVWVDTTKRRVLRLELDNEGVIRSIIVSAVDPISESLEKPVDVPLPSIKLASGRGLRVAHEGYGDAKREYGEPDTFAEVVLHGVSVDVMTYTFEKAPRYMAVCVEHGGGRILQIKLAMEPDPPAK